MSEIGQRAATLGQLMAQPATSVVDAQLMTSAVTLEHLGEIGLERLPDGTYQPRGGRIELPQSAADEEPVGFDLALAALVPSPALAIRAARVQLAVELESIVQTRREGAMASLCDGMARQAVGRPTSSRRRRSSADTVQCHLQMRTGEVSEAERRICALLVLSMP